MWTKPHPYHTLPLCLNINRGELCETLHYPTVFHSSQDCNELAAAREALGGRWVESIEHTVGSQLLEHVGTRGCVKCSDN